MKWQEVGRGLHKGHYNLYFSPSIMISIIMIKSRSMRWAGDIV
jgi:hypothetical protein